MKFKQFFMFMLLGRSNASCGGPSVTIANGTLQGGKCEAGDVNYFLSIPYARPPVGDLRFVPPQPIVQAYGVRNASVPAPPCYQFGPLFAENGTQSEDCLFVQVWAPANASQLPVRVWIYGGADATGGVSNPMYDGCPSSAATNTILVTVNYRLGPLGWLSLDKAGLTGNYGLSDQLFALQWVQENIKAFGGDKHKVMVFGESSGAWDTWALASLPQAPSLMKAAVMESGAGVHFPTLAEADAFNELYTSYLNCSDSDIACLRSKTPEQLVDGVNALPASGAPPVYSRQANMGRGSEFGPVVDTIVVPEQPLNAGLKVPSIAGSNTNEGAIIDWGVYTLLEGISVDDLTPTDYDVFLESSFGSLAGVVNDTYPYYSNGSVFNTMNEVNTLSFRCPTRRALRSGLRNGVPVWTYRFNHVPSCRWVWQLPEDEVATLGPTHISEVPFVFGQVINLPLPFGTCNFTTTEKEMSAAMMAAWASMAETGTPGGKWPLYTDDASQGVVYNEAAVVGTVDYTGCDFWDEIDAQTSA